MYKPLQALGLVRTRVVIPSLYAEASFFLPHERTSYADLVALLHNSFAGLAGATSLDIVYRDDEGDAIRVKTDPELREALRLGQTLDEPLTLQVTPVMPAAPAEAAPAPAEAASGKISVEVELPDSSMLRLEADASDPVASVKRLLAAHTSIPIEMQELFMQGEAEEAAAAPADAHVVHQAWCDGCDATIVGVRYKCLVCPDFDFDSACYEHHVASGRALHDASHEFRQITGTSATAAATTTTTPTAPARRTGAGCPRRQRVVHNATCDSCRAFIHGIRYKCVNCPDFDLCERCESRNANGALHSRDHLFVKIRRPIKFGYRSTLPLFYNEPTPAPAPAPAPAPTPAPAPAPAAVERLADIEKRLAELRNEVKTLARAEAAKKRKEEAAKRKQEAAAARRAERQAAAAAARAEAERRERELAEQRALAEAEERAAAEAEAEAEAARQAAERQAAERAIAEAAEAAAQVPSEFELNLRGLEGMGFTNVERNQVLLHHFNNDLQSVIEALLGEM